MAERTIVVTGASSYAGRLLVNAIAGRPDLHAVAVYSSQQSSEARSTAAITRLVADLRRPLSGPQAKVINDAHVVFHLAWVRGHDRNAVETANDAMIENLFASMTAPERLVFISTAASGADAPSVYGLAKFKAERQVRRLGGSVLSAGIILGTPAQGAYRAIESLVCRLPLRIRFGGGFRFYAASEQEFIASCLSFLDHLPPAEYCAFPPEGETAAQFLSSVEQSCPRWRLPILLPDRLMLRSIRALARARLLPRGIAERLMTFLYADSERLAKLHRLPG